MQVGEQLALELGPLYGRADVTTDEVLAAVLRAYTAEMGEAIDAASIDDLQRQRLRDYLLDAQFGPTLASLHHKIPTLSHLPLFESMAAKLSWFHQHGCQICGPLDGGPYARNFPVEVPPWSHQTHREFGPALKQAIQANPTYANRYPVLTVPLCVRLVFVLEDGATMKDCDNMAKGLIDAFQGVLFENDRQIEHLDLIKVHHAPGSQGFVLVRFASTTINDHHRDVIQPDHARILWMDSLSLRIKDFLPPPKTGTSPPGSGASATPWGRRRRAAGLRARCPRRSERQDRRRALASARYGRGHRSAGAMRRPQLAGCGVGRAPRRTRRG